MCKGVEPAIVGNTQVRWILQQRSNKDGLCAPCERDLDVLLIDGKPEVEQFKLSIVSVKEISASGAVLSCTSHVLPEAIQGGAFLGIPFGVIAIGVLDVMLEWMYPVDLVGGLEWHRYHGDLRHDGAGCISEAGLSTA